MEICYKCADLIRIDPAEHASHRPNTRLPWMYSVTLNEYKCLDPLENVILINKFLWQIFNSGTYKPN